MNQSEFEVNARIKPATSSGKHVRTSYISNGFYPVSSRIRHLGFLDFRKTDRTEIEHNKRNFPRKVKKASS